MIKAAQRVLIGGLERLDWLLDSVPTVEWEDGRPRLFWQGGWGCRLGLAAWSEALDRRWDAGVWRWVDEGP